MNGVELPEAKVVCWLMQRSGDFRGLAIGARVELASIGNIDENEMFSKRRCALQQDPFKEERYHVTGPSFIWYTEWRVLAMLQFIDHDCHCWD